MLFGAVVRSLGDIKRPYCPSRSPQWRERGGSGQFHCEDETFEIGFPSPRGIMTATDDDTITVHCECITITPVHGAGRLLALADVVVEIGGITVQINAVRVEQAPAGTAVRLPLDRQGRPLVVLPEEVREALGDTVLAAGIEVGILKERFAVTA